MMMIGCQSCGNRWKADVPESLYLQLELAGQPCPKCEACTLEYQETSRREPPRSWHVWQRERADRLARRRER